MVCNNELSHVVVLDDNFFFRKKLVIVVDGTILKPPSLNMLGLATWIKKILKPPPLDMPGLATWIKKNIKQCIFCVKLLKRRS
jgi:hypothetical protein